MITTQSPCEIGQPAPAAAGQSSPFDWPRKPLGKRYVYAVISPRARGLSIGINLNPTRHCNFDCIYCEVDRTFGATHDGSPLDGPVDLDVLARELERTLALVHNGEFSIFSVPSELLRLRHVAVSGDGEPTLCPNFGEALETIVHLRASAQVPHFKIVLITNASALDRPQVIYGIGLLTRQDEIWAKLDGGTQGYIDRINRAQVPLTKVIENIRTLGHARPVIIQTMIPAIHGQNPFESEIAEYVARLRELKAAGTQISLVQIYSANRPTPHSECAHLPLRSLSEIAKIVRARTGLRTEVF
jgi:wyosine [tRNA(Phe)-imidazoG37] synthetase (radical SAM superfamily)